MSSHHFVKEGQEPALVIIHALDHERVAPLLEWAPLVLVHENSLDEVIRWGIKIDGVICKPDNVSKVTNALADQLPLTIIKIDSDRDGVDSIIEFLVNEKQEAVCLVVDEIKKITDLPLTLIRKLNITLLTADLRWSFIKNGRFEKWMSKEQKFSVVQSTPFRERVGVTEEGAQLITTRDGLIRLVNEQPFWLGEEY